MVFYWIKVASNTFENTYWLKQIYLIFTTSTEAAVQQWMECQKLHELEKRLMPLLRDVWYREKSRTMAYTTHNTVNRLACKELHLNPVVPE